MGREGFVEGIEDLDTRINLGLIIVVFRGATVELDALDPAREIKGITCLKKVAAIRGAELKREFALEKFVRHPYRAAFEGDHARGLFLLFGSRDQINRDDDDDERNERKKRKEKGRDVGRIAEIVSKVIVLELKVSFLPDLVMFSLLDEISRLLGTRIGLVLQDKSQDKRSEKEERKKEKEGERKNRNMRRKIGGLRGSNTTFVVFDSIRPSMHIFFCVGTDEIDARTSDNLKEKDILFDGKTNLSVVERDHAAVLAGNDLRRGKVIQIEVSKDKPTTFPCLETRTLLHQKALLVWFAQRGFHLFRDDRPSWCLLLALGSDGCCP